MEDPIIPKNNIKYIIIAFVSVLGLLLIAYLIIWQIKARQTTPTPPTPPAETPTPYIIPSYTPVPSTSTEPTPNSEGKSFYSPLDQKTIDERDQFEVINNPDFVVSNNSPYNNEYFLVTTVPVDVQPKGYYKIVVYQNIEDRVLVDSKLKEWLRSLRLPDESIAKLKIEYQNIAKPLSE